MKKIGVFVAVLLCICAVLGGFYYVIDKNKTAAEDNTKLTEVEKVITKAILSSSAGWKVNPPGSLSQALSSVPAGAKPIKKVSITGIKQTRAITGHSFL